MTYLSTPSLHDLNKVQQTTKVRACHPQAIRRSIRLKRKVLRRKHPAMVMMTVRQRVKSDFMQVYHHPTYGQ